MPTDFSQVAEQVDSGNYKGIGDNYQTLWQEQLQGLIGLQAKINDQYLTFVQNSQTLTQRTADGNALLLGLSANNTALASQAAAVDSRLWGNLVMARYMTNAGDISMQNISAKVAEDVGDTFNKAIRETAVNSANAGQVTSAGMETVGLNQVAAILAGQSTVIQKLTSDMATLTAALVAFLNRENSPVKPV